LLAANTDQKQQDHITTQYSLEQTPLTSEDFESIAELLPKEEKK
jgi:hypothetical protein